MCLLIATPALIFPILTWLAKTRFSPEQIGLAVFAFASLGHHLPGVMRAYGDRQLFSRYRWRFLIAPPCALAVSWASFIWLELNGLALILLFWATWHILMQTYGFMRIYDSKRGQQSVWDARLDFWVCVSVFAVGVVFSDARVFGIADAASKVGLPMIEASWLSAARWLIGVGTGLLLSAYVVRSLYTCRSFASIAGLKLLLLLSTACLYWITGRLSMNILLGVAMFEVFHALQYYAIVWSFNRRRADRVGSDFGPLRPLFRGKWWGLPSYIVAIVLFGAVGFWGRGGEAGSVSVVMALFSASALLHFYYDGFIWKVSEKKTREDLNISGASIVSPQRSSTPHALKWSAFAVLLITLGMIEYHGKPTRLEEEQRFEQLSELTPRLPEVQIQASQASLRRGDDRQAYELASEAVRLRPRSYDAHLALGSSAVKVADWTTAERSFVVASELRPDSADALYGLGVSQIGGEKPGDARHSLEACLAIRGSHAQTHFQLGIAYYRTQNPDLAIASYRRSIEMDPGFADVYNNLGEVLFESGDLKEAKAAYQKTLQLQPNQYKAHFQLGNVYYLSDQLDKAIVCYEHCNRVQPEFVDAYNNLAAALIEMDRLSEAEAICRTAVEVQGSSASAHYNLGLVLFFQGRDRDARASLIRARELGQRPSRELANELGL